MLKGKISWIGFGNKLLYEKIDSNNYKKIFEIPFKLSDSEKRYILRIVCEKTKGRILYFYSFFEVISEHSGIMDTLLIDSNVSPKNNVFLSIINHKTLRFKLVWIFGLSHLFFRKNKKDFL